MTKNQSSQITSAVIVFNKKLLLLQTDDTSGIKSPAQWQLPGGEMEKGEISEYAIRRKLQEELGIIPRNLSFLASPYHGVYIYYASLAKEEASKIKRGGEKKDLRFFSLDELSNIPLTQELQQALETHRGALESLLR